MGAAVEEFGGFAGACCRFGRRILELFGSEIVNGGEDAEEGAEVGFEGGAVGGGDGGGDEVEGDAVGFVFVVVGDEEEVGDGGDGAEGVEEGLGVEVDAFDFQEVLFAADDWAERGSCGRRGRDRCGGRRGRRWRNAGGAGLRLPRG